MNSAHGSVEAKTRHNTRDRLSLDNFSGLWFLSALAGPITTHNPREMRLYWRNHAAASTHRTP